MYRSLERGFLPDGRVNIAKPFNTVILRFRVGYFPLLLNPRGSYG